MWSLQTVAEWTGVGVEVLRDLLWTGGILSLYVTLRYALGALARRHLNESRSRYAVRKAINLTLTVVVFVALVVVWTDGGQGIATYLAILSAGIAVSLGAPLANLAAWLFIVARQPFRLGDRIEINGQRGDIVDISAFQFSLVEIGNWVDADQSTGRLVHIPNAWVFRHAAFNYTLGFEFIWEELPVTVTFESDWRKAKEILSGIAARVVDVSDEKAAGELTETAERYAVRYQFLTPIVWTSVADIGVTLTIRYVCRPRRRRSTAALVWEEVLTAFAEEDDIDFAYPTTRFYDNRAEGKPGASASE
jgi:small-conductance mechanosensitive channel